MLLSLEGATIVVAPSSFYFIAINMSINNVIKVANENQNFANIHKIILLNIHNKIFLVVDIGSCLEQRKDMPTESQ